MPSVAQMLLKSHNYEKLDVSHYSCTFSHQISLGKKKSFALNLLSISLHALAN